MDIQWVFFLSILSLFSEKPGYCVSSSIKLQDCKNSESQLKILSFPSLSSHIVPSFLAYDEAILYQLASSLPLSVDSSFEIPFLLYITDTL